MAELAATADRGWSWFAGWSQADKAFIARARKPREKPIKTPSGVTLCLHSLSASGSTIDEAASRCAAEVAEREAGKEHHSDYERRYIKAVERKSA